MLRIQSKWVRALGAFGLAAAVALVAGCGGGGGGGGSSSTSSGTSGGTSSGNTAVSSLPATLASNQIPVVVSSGLTGRAPNMPMVSVTVCAHGTNTCQTINNIQLDTGSYGLRLTADNVSTTLFNALPVEIVGGVGVAECAGFADGNGWGSVRTADVTIGGETASNIPIQIFGDTPQSAAGGAHNACASGTLNNTSSQIAAHGILGIGSAKYDCGSGPQGCTSAPNGVYYGCTTAGGVTTCGDLGVPIAQQVGNPIAFFPVDNNGVILNMPAVTAAGATSASGYLTFGIGTEANNALASGAQKLQTDHFGTVQSASLSGTAVTSGFFDSGSNGLFFPDSAIALCSVSTGFYCPASPVSLQPSVTGFNAVAVSLPVTIGNAQTLFNSGGYAFNNIGGNAIGSGAFDFGMPFFYGRTVYIGYDSSTANTSGAASPAFVAF